jgi:dTDP-4-amino-4,6-dideoxygalactose transaminase
MAVPLIDLSAQHEAMLPELVEVFREVAASGRFILGKRVRELEQSLAELCDAGHCVAMGSGTDALMVTLMALGIGPGDEVVTTPLSYPHTAGSIARVGATPVFADIHPLTFNLDPDAVAGAVSPATKAVLPTHLYGLPADMDAIRDAVASRGITVIEDADQALGAAYHDRPAGGLGDVGLVSFFPTKNLPAMGDFGAVLTRDGELAARFRRLRMHGLDEDYRIEQIGGNFRPDALQAAILNHKLPHLGTWIDARRRLARRYDRALEDMPVSPPTVPPGRKHSFNQYTVRVRGGGRDALAAHLEAKGIGCRVYYPVPLHRQPVFEHLGYAEGSLPEAESACEEVLSLPMFPEMTDAQHDEVVATVRQCFEGD